MHRTQGQAGIKKVMRANSLTTLFGAMAALVSINAHAALVSAAGGLAVYDSTNNVT
jgi:hypothetical protein